MWTLNLCQFKTNLLWVSHWYWLTINVSLTKRNDRIKHIQNIYNISLIISIILYICFEGRKHERHVINVGQIKAQNKPTKRNKTTEEKKPNDKRNKNNTVYGISCTISITLYMHISLEEHPKSRISESSATHKLLILRFMCLVTPAIFMDRSVYAPSQWETETVLQRNAISHCLDTYTEWSLQFPRNVIQRRFLYTLETTLTLLFKEKQMICIGPEITIRQHRHAKMFEKMTMEIFLTSSTQQERNDNLLWCQLQAFFKFRVRHMMSIYVTNLHCFNYSHLAHHNDIITGAMVSQITSPRLFT